MFFYKVAMIMAATVAASPLVFTPEEIGDPKQCNEENSRCSPSISECCADLSCQVKGIDMVNGTCVKNTLQE